MTSVAFSPDGKTVAAGYGGDGVGGVVLWDAATREAAGAVAFYLGRGRCEWRGLQPRRQGDRRHERGRTADLEPERRPVQRPRAPRP